TACTVAAPQGAGPGSRSRADRLLPQTAGRRSAQRVDVRGRARAGISPLVRVPGLQSPSAGGGSVRATQEPLSPPVRDEQDLAGGARAVRGRVLAWASRRF